MMLAGNLGHHSNTHDFEKVYYLLSYPRSGNTWLRYILEHITAHKSFGYPNSSPEIDGKPIANYLPEEFWDPTGVIRKRHKWESGEPKRRKGEERVSFLLLRNPVDLCARNAIANVSGKEMYMDLLFHWNNTTHKKALITYDSLLLEPERIIRWIPEFLGLDEGCRRRAEDFIANLDSHKKKSIGRADQSRAARVDSALESADFDEQQIASTLNSFNGAGRSGASEFKIIKDIFTPGAGNRLTMLENL